MTQVFFVGHTQRNDVPTDPQNKMGAVLIMQIGAFNLENAVE